MTLTITRPDDLHLHLRDGQFMRSVVDATARVFGRAVIMPNLDPPITTVAAAAEYRQRILAALPAQSRFEPLMTLYLTDSTTPEEIKRARAAGFIIGVKYYPAGATTNSESGVSDLARTYAVLAEMEQSGLPLLVHGEVTDADVDIFDRERVFIEHILAGIVRDFPALKLVLEHMTTRDAVKFVEARRICRRNDHAAAPAVVAQRPFCRRHPAPPVLPADTEARDPSAGPGRGGDGRQPEILSRHRFGAARAAYQRERVRLRGLLLGAGRASSSTPSVRSRGCA